MLRVIMIGAPGCGKGTQCKWIKEEYDVPHISTGEIFRKNIAEKTPLGEKAKEYIDKGLLVPDEITIAIVTKRLSENDCIEKGFILDGFPRTLRQAVELEQYLKDNDIEIDKVINIDVPDEEIIKRSTNRRVCKNPECHEIYHLIYNPPMSDDKCDKCGSKLMQRDDDKEEIVTTRLKSYHKQTEPLLRYYEERNKLSTVLGQLLIEDTIALVKEELEK